MGINLTLQDAANASALTEILGPGAGGNTLFAVRGLLDLVGATVPLYMQLFDQATYPSTGDVPVISKQFDASGFAELAFGLVGRKAAHNSWVVVSSTPLTFSYAGRTGGGNVKALFDVQYV